MEWYKLMKEVASLSDELVVELEDVLAAVGWSRMFGLCSKVNKALVE